MSRKSINVLAFDIGGTKTSALLATYICGSDQLPQILSIKTRQTIHGTLTHRQIASFLQSLGEDAIKGQIDFRPDVVGASVGGPLSLKQRRLINPPHLPGWESLPLEDILEKSFGVPAFMEHDGNTGALAEYYFGAGRGCDNMIFLTLGTGIGAGFILDRKLYRGSTDSAGEIGHLKLADDGPMAFGKKACSESFCSGSGMVKLARWLFPEEDWGDKLTAKDLIQMSEEGHESAHKVVTLATRKTGELISLLTDTLNPDRIVLGSLGYYSSDIYIQNIRRYVSWDTLPEAASHVQIIKNELKDKLQPTAAVMAALYRYSEEIESVLPSSRAFG